MKYSSYYKLGNACQEYTNAITSNEKIILPYNNQYFKKYTLADIYPGHEEDKTLLNNNKPKNIIDNVINKLDTKKVNKNCKNCSNSF